MCSCVRFSRKILFCARGCTEPHAGAHRCTSAGALCSWVRSMCSWVLRLSVEVLGGFFERLQLATISVHWLPLRTIGSRALRLRLKAKGRRLKFFEHEGRRETRRVRLGL